MMRAARRTARSIQLSLFLLEFTDISAIIKDRRAILPTRINRPFNEGERERERAKGRRARHVRSRCGRGSKGKQKGWREVVGDRSPRDLIRLRWKNSRG